MLRSSSYAWRGHASRKACFGGRGLALIPAYSSPNRGHGSRHSQSFSLTSSRVQPRIKLHWKTLDRLKDRIRDLTRRKRGRSLQAIITELNEYLRGWWGYFSAMETPLQLKLLSGWIRRRLRSYIWKQWKNRRTRAGNLMKLGLAKKPQSKQAAHEKELGA